MTPFDLSHEHVLVTGGAGFIGGGVVDALLERGSGVTVADLKPVRPRHADRVHGVQGDLRDPSVREKALTPDTTAVVHLAALTSVLESKRRPVEVHQTNVDMTAGLLELAREHDVDRFVLASTNAVVGDVGWDTIDEVTPLRPLTPYGATKAAGEMLLSGYAGSYGIRACAMRLTNVYGPGMSHKDSFIPRLMKAARDGTGVEIYGDGEQVRDFVHLSDVVRGLFTIWHVQHVGPLIIGSGRSVSVNDLVEETRAATGVDIPATHVDPKPGEMPAVIVDVARARSLGYEPQVTLRDGLEQVWSDFRSGRETFQETTA